jgi:protein-S-isoprenylcysteine O-methyltransferase Ste14
MSGDGGAWLRTLTSRCKAGVVECLGRHSWLGDTRSVPVPDIAQSDLARIALEVSIGAFVVGEAWQAFHVRRGATRDNLRAEILFRAMFFSGILVLPVGRALVPGAALESVWLFSLGAVITWFGLILRWWSFVTLGKYFTVVVMTSDDQAVVDHGPYRMLRHPSYTGLLLAFAGGGLMLGNWASTLGAVGVVLLGLIYRLRIEERALTAALGDRYRVFAASRARLVPYVW